jgi:hypothetical protein
MSALAVLFIPAITIAITIFDWASHVLGEIVLQS